MKKIRIAGVLATLGAIVLLTACSSSASAAGGQGGSSTKLTTINISVSPTASTSVPIYLGVEKGFFKQHGLDLKISVLTNGTVAIPQVVSGQNQFSAASFAPVIQAVGQKLPIKVVGTGNIISTTDSQFQGFIVRSDYTGSTLADAHTIAAQSTLVDPVQADSVDKTGGDYMSMKILQVPLASMADAVRTGQADTALLPQPFLAQALATPGIKLLNYVGTSESMPGTPGAVYIGASNYMASHAQVTKEFQAALVESYAYAQKHLQEEAEYVPKTGLSNAVPTVAAMGAFPTAAVSKSKYQELLDAYTKYGQNSHHLTASDILYASAK